jgi:hypothetical protein
MNTPTWRYSATLSGHSALDGDECDVMFEMPNEEQCSVVLPQKCSISFSSILLTTTRLQTQSDLRTQCTDTVYIEFQWVSSSSKVNWRTDTRRICKFADVCTVQRNYSTSIFHPCKRNCHLKISRGTAIRCHISNYTQHSWNTGRYNNAI